MAIRDRRLDRLSTRFECHEPWDAMRGDARRRFCEACRREVFDFSSMTAPEVRARLEAHRGRLCARLTHHDGRLLTLVPQAPPSPEPMIRSRAVSTVAASVVSTLLCLARAEAEAPAAPAVVASSPDTEPKPEAPRRPRDQERSGPSAALQGRLLDEKNTPLRGAEIVARGSLSGLERTATSNAEGAFLFPDLEPGLYDLSGTLEQYTIHPKELVAVQPGERHRVELTARSEQWLTTTGVMIAVAESLRKVFADSTLVVEATVGASRRVGDQYGLDDIATRLEIDTLLKGDIAGRSLSFRHVEPPFDPEEDDAGPPELAPGTKVLAFLQPLSADRPGGDARSFESADHGFGIKRLDDETRAAYVLHLEALAALHRKSERVGALDPAEWMEWLVATAEDPTTRHEAIGEIRNALDELQNLAETWGTSSELAAADLRLFFERAQAAGEIAETEPRLELLGAALTESQRARLTAALRRATSLRDSEVVLFGLVWSWEPETATSWLAKALRHPEAEDVDHWDTVSQLLALARVMNLEAIQEHWREPYERTREIQQRWPDDESAAAEQRREKELASLRADLRRQLVEALPDAASGHR